MVKMAGGEQDHGGGAAGALHSFYNALRLVAGVDDGADLGLLVLQNVAVGPDGAYGKGVNFHSISPYNSQ